MKIYAGGVVTGDNFYHGRLKIVEQLEQKLQQNDVLIVGPRRTGKTSVIQEYLERSSNSGGDSFQSVFIDLESTKNLFEFYLRVIKGIYSESKKIRGFFRDGFDALKALSNKLNEVFEGELDVSDFLDSPIDTVIKLRPPKFEPKKIEELDKELQHLLLNVATPVTIVLDEFPELIWKLGKDEHVDKQGEIRKELTQVLLSGLRTVRQEGYEKRHRVIVAGSVNLDNTLAYLDLKQTINDMERVRVPYLSVEEAVELLDLLSKGQNFQYETEDLCKEFLQKQFGKCSPFYVQSFAARLLQLKLENSKITKFTLDHFKKAYKELLLDPTSGPSYLRDRIRRYYSKDEQQYLEILLGFIAKNQFKGVGRCLESDCLDAIESKMNTKLTRAEKSNFVAKIYSDDLVQISDDGECFEFASKLICNYWHYTLVGSEYLS